MKIKFLEARTEKAVGGASFVAGQVVNLSEASAQHWISRGVAERVDDDAKAEAKKPGAK